MRDTRLEEYCRNGHLEAAPALLCVYLHRHSIGPPPPLPSWHVGCVRLRIQISSQLHFDRLLCNRCLLCWGSCLFGLSRFWCFLGRLRQSSEGSKTKSANAESRRLLLVRSSSESETKPTGLLKKVASNAGYSLDQTLRCLSRRLGSFLCSLGSLISRLLHLIFLLLLGFDLLGSLGLFGLLLEK